MIQTKKKFIPAKRQGKKTFPHAHTAVSSASGTNSGRTKLKCRHITMVILTCLSLLVLTIALRPRETVAPAQAGKIGSAKTGAVAQHKTTGTTSVRTVKTSFAQQPSKKNNTKKKKPTTITISAAGDCTFGSDQSSPANVNFYSVYNKKKPGYFFRNVKKYFKNDDLTLVNFEGTLTTSHTRMDKTFAFKGAPSYVKLLAKGSIEAVSFANNHCRDYGEQSYTDTIRTFQKAGIKYASYNKVTIYKTNGKRIGMVAVNGLLGTDYSKNLISSGIKKLKKRRADLIIVSMHAGIEHTSSLDSTQKELGHYAVQKGANLVLGHHPHTLQGIERYRGAYIVYSLANFCFGGNTNPSDKDTIIFQQTFTFKGDKLKKDKNIRIIPCMVSSTTAINNYQPSPLKGAARQRVINRMNTYSKPLGVQFTKNGRVRQ